VKASTIGECARGWELLAAADASLPTQDLPWALASLDAFGGEAAFLAQGTRDAPRAIAPMIRRGRRLELTGGEMFEPGDLLADSADSLAALAAGLARDGAPLLLARLPPQSPTIAALRTAVAPRGAVHVRTGVGYPSIRLDDRWREPGGGLSTSRRSALRRARRRAERSGEISVQLLAPAADDVPALLDQAFAIEARSWKGVTGTALAHDRPRARFVRRYAEETAKRGTLRLQFLRIGGEAVAMQIAVEWNDQIWLLKIGYDDAHAAASPGQLLLAESIADAARRDLDSYQLLGEAADWTRVWTSEEQACVTVRAYPATARAAVQLTADTQRLVRRRARQLGQDAQHNAGRIAASRYVAGPNLDDALRAQARCAAAQFATSIGFWSADQTPANEVARRYLDAAGALPEGGELSIKLHAFGGDRPGLDELLDHCRERGLRLHLDSLWPATADASLQAASRLAALAPGSVGCTLTGRWQRSVADARDVIAAQLRVRVVKSEWADPDDPERDPGGGFLKVVDALAGAAAFVAVATHDGPLAAEALQRLIGAGTPCELQVLYAINGRAAVREARRLAVPTRVYVPYGHGRVPYATEGLSHQPATIARVAFDLLPLRPRLAHLTSGARSVVNPVARSPLVQG
jgi:CelD/BcsL family acetyltransferase involved in cellulose biosynthesis